MEALIGILTVIINGVFTYFNVGKNRTIYEVEELINDTSTKNSIKKLNDKLNTKKYTILSVHQDFGNFTKRIYVLGRIAK